MKLQRDLTINDDPYPVVDADVRLQLSNAGRASFTVQGAPPAAGLTRFELGYTSLAKHVFFLGYVERVIPVDDKHSKILCREYSAIFANLLPISMRNVSLETVLAEVSSQSNLAFEIPNESYTSKPVPDFVSLGSGFLLLNSLRRTFRVPQFMWQQRVNGKIFVGSWVDSHWAGKDAHLPIKMLTRHKANQSAEIPIIPTLRPGARFNGNYVSSVMLLNQKMVIQWKTRFGG